MSKTLYLPDTKISHMTFVPEHGDVILHSTAQASPNRSSSLDIPVRKVTDTSYRIHFSELREQKINIPFTGVTVKRPAIHA